MHDTSTSPFGQETQRYWDNRHELFSRWDEGIETDGEGLFSVKPERLAERIAELLSGEIVLDGFCGIGGSAIAFAHAGKRVIAADVESRRLEMARHNAEIYGVAERIEFRHTDVFDIIHDAEFDALYLDPPWGGPEYYRKERFLWSDFSPNPLPLIKTAMNRGKAFAVTVPVNFNMPDLAALAEHVHVEPGFDREGRLLFVTAFVSSS